MRQSVTERSNWAWEPETKQSYWHRFFSHQPDLNYDNPQVREESWRVMQFWLIQVRKSSKAFGRGATRRLYPANHRILAYVRTFEDDQLLIVNNLASTAQAVELDLAECEGAIPVEMFGGSLFPRVGAGSYTLTLL